MDKIGKSVHMDVKQFVHVANTFYLFYYGGKACLFPFLTLYFRQIGLSASQTGLALGAKAFVWFCISPVWLALERRVRKTRTILCYSIFIVIGSNLVLSVLPAANPQMPLYVCRNESSPFPADWFNDSDAASVNVPFTGILENKSSTSSILSTASPHTKNFSSTLEVLSHPIGDIRVPDATSALLALPSEQSSMVEQENVAIASTTTEKAAPTTTELPIFQLAKSFLPVLERNALTSRDGDLILEFIEEQQSTAEWPKWKQAVILRHILSLLRKEEKAKLIAPWHGNNVSSPKRRGIRGISWSKVGSKRSLEMNSTESVFVSGAQQKENLTLISQEKDSAIEGITFYLLSNTYLFWYVLVILAAGELLSAPVELISDNSLYNLLDELYSLSQYGKHRSSALIGAALCGITSSIIVYMSPCFINGTINRFHVHFYLFALMLGISFVLAAFYPSYDPVSNSTRSQLAERSPVKFSLTIWSNGRHILLLVTMLIVGIAQAPMQNFLLWVVQDMDGSSELVYGSFVSANAICAMVSGSFGRKMIKVLKPCGSAFVSLISIAIQLVCCAFISNPWLIVPLQLLNITGFSFLWTVISQYSSTTMSSAYQGSQKISSVHMFARMSQQRTLHATYISIYQGLAFSFGSIISGFLYDYTRGRMFWIFVGYGILVAVWATIFVLLQRCCFLSKVTRKYSHLLSESESDMDQVEIDEFNRNYILGNGNYRNAQEARKKRKDKRKATLPPIDNDMLSDLDEGGWPKASKKDDAKM